VVARRGITEVDDWASYYAARDLPLESPAALLLSFPLTLHHLLATHGGRAVRTFL
jgi:hypothetical protein